MLRKRCGPFQAQGVELAAFAGSDQRAALQPFAGRWDRANAAPQPAGHRNHHHDQERPPHDPDEHDAEVAVPRGRAEQPGKDRQHEKRQHERDREPLRPAALEQAIDEWNVSDRVGHGIDADFTD